jgi:hypothetical protein
MATNNDYYSKLDDPDYLTERAKIGGFDELINLARRVETETGSIPVMLQTALMENRPGSSAPAGPQTRTYDFNVPSEAVAGLKGKSPKDLAGLVDYYKQGGFPVPEPVKALVALRARQPAAQPPVQDRGELDYFERNPEAMETREGVFVRGTREKLANNLSEAMAIDRMRPTDFPNFIARREPPAPKPAPAQAAAAEDDYERENWPGPKFNKHRIYDIPPASLEAWPDDGATETPAQPQATVQVDAGGRLGPLFGFERANEAPPASLAAQSDTTAIPVKTASVRSNAPRPVSNAIRPTTPAAAAPPKAPPEATPATPAPAAPPKVDPWAAMERQRNLPPMQSLLVNRPTVSSDAAAPSAPTVAAPVPPVGGATPPGATAAVPPQVEAGAGGDDEMNRLSMGQALIRALEGSGSVISGQNLRSGAADVLADRMKQIEALRAKRQERADELAREDAQSAAIVEQYKSLADQGLVPSIKGLDRMPYKQAASLIKTYASLPGTVARTEKTAAEIPLVQARVGDVQAATALKGAKAADIPKNAESRDALRQAQIQKLRRQTAANVVGLTKSAKVVEDAGKSGVPPKEAIKYIRDDLKTAEKAISPTLENFKNIEAAAPGFAFGRPPKDIETLDFVKAATIPRFADKARDLRTAVEALIIDIRHGSFGASLTATEKASFETMLNTGLSGTVEQLSRAVNKIRTEAANTAQTHFNTSMTFFPNETARVLSTSNTFGPATREGGVYSDVWKIKAPAAGGAATTTGMTRMTGPDGKRYDVPSDKVEAAKAKGWKE